MDEIVRQAMAKWPNVPHCRGWLALDARGAFRMRDEAAQAANAAGDVIRHPALLSFIYRNYSHDEHGAWYFQNGPQRVYVELEDTPLVWRVGADQGVTSHTGQAAQVRACVLDENGRVYLDTDLGFGLVHSLDMHQAADAIEAGAWPLQELPSSELPARFGFVRSPAACRGENAKA